MSRGADGCLLPPDGQMDDPLIANEYRVEQLASIKDQRSVKAFPYFDEILAMEFIPLRHDYQRIAGAIQRADCIRIRRSEPTVQDQRIIPAPTVLLDDSSMTMNAPVSRLAA